MTTVPAGHAPRVVIFAGPNGAGKSTHADAILQATGIGIFVNADYIARGLSGIHPETVAIAAGRIMLRRLNELAQARADFAFESTLASRSFAPFLKRLKARGYRVALGGHDVPADVVRRRFERSRTNFFELYIPLANQWALLDNSRMHQTQLIAECIDNDLVIKKLKTWARLNPAPNA
jgi:predicted ABC-type ATPase